MQFTLDLVMHFSSFGLEKRLGTNVNFSVNISATLTDLVTWLIECLWQLALKPKDTALKSHFDQ